MEKIASFTVNHLKLEPGVYLSRVDRDPDTGCLVTTFDLRMTAPNREPVIDTDAVHAIEHMGASFLRNHPVWGPKTVYFGPMGCRTGFYLVVFGESTPEQIVPLVSELYAFIRDYEGEVPGAAPRDCGNWHDSSLPMAQWWARRYLEQTLDGIDEAHMTYPE